MENKYLTMTEEEFERAIDQRIQKRISNSQLSRSNFSPGTVAQSSLYGAKNYAMLAYMGSTGQTGAAGVSVVINFDTIRTLRGKAITVDLATDTFTFNEAGLYIIGYQLWIDFPTAGSFMDTMLDYTPTGVFNGAGIDQRLINVGANTPSAASPMRVAPSAIHYLAAGSKMRVVAGSASAWQLWNSTPYFGFPVQYAYALQISDASRVLYSDIGGGL